MVNQFLKKTIKQALSPFMTESMIEHLKIRFRNFHAHPPIIVYQMGKVGSKTVCKSLQQAKLQNSIYHVHFLSHNGIKEAEKYYCSKNLSLEHLQVSKELREKIDTTTRKNWKIITLVREPISRDISDVFQNIERFYPHLIDENGNIKKKEVIEFLKELFIQYDERTDYTCTWFDRELKDAFNIDVYAYPFDHKKGFTIIHEAHIELLILRLEDLDKTFSTALHKFLNPKKRIPMIKSNIGEEKKYSHAYRETIRQIDIPFSLCTQVYSSKYAQHFYSERLRKTFIQKWSKNQSSDT